MGYRVSVFGCISCVLCRYLGPLSFRLPSLWFETRVLALDPTNSSKQQAEGALGLGRVCLAATRCRGRDGTFTFAITSASGPYAAASEYSLEDPISHTHLRLSPPLPPAFALVHLLSPDRDASASKHSFEVVIDIIHIARDETERITQLQRQLEEKGAKETTTTCARRPGFEPIISSFDEEDGAMRELALDVLLKYILIRGRRCVRPG
ncbi:uncharacterized protein FIBRA_09196 [Fibroporia radiculosa]|uniref:Uncharacterized protein n=1 Tax=Fibroporia radiculosa TaxID=599839 RepID=J7SC50_9APHY|nr:uncharacterized protein FIBRA_09196 [Fibroporia radiculosa]CCM06886.1 predicted protein [Fibroporia radiculosa]